MNTGGFSWRRLLGITAFKSRMSRKFGIPLTASGRRRKLGALMFNAVSSAVGRLAAGAAAATDNQGKPRRTPVPKPLADAVSAIQAEAARTKAKESWQAVLVYFESVNRNVYQIIKAETEDIHQALQDGMTQVGFVGMQDAPGGIRFAFALNDGLPMNGGAAKRFVANATEWVAKESRDLCARKGLPAPVVNNLER